MMLSRRGLLQYAASASALAATGAIPASLSSAFADEGKRVIPWKNWSGGLSCTPALRAAPASEAELAEIVTAGATPVRAVGAGHSFSPLVPTEGTLLSLDRMSGIVAHDAATHRATIKAGTRLGAMAAELAVRREGCRREARRSLLRRRLPAPQALQALREQARHEPRVRPQACRWKGEARRARRHRQGPQAEWQPRGCGPHVLSRPHRDARFWSGRSRSPLSSPPCSQIVPGGSSRSAQLAIALDVCPAPR